MALYNTLFRFPSTVAHGAHPAGQPIISVPEDTLVRWYWRVRRWRVEMRFSGNWTDPQPGDNPLGSTSITVTNARASAEFEQSFDGTHPIQGEDDLRRPYCHLIPTSTSASVDALTTTPAGSGATASGYLDWQVFLGNAASFQTLYNPATKQYEIAPSGFRLDASADDGSYVSVGIAAYYGSDPGTVHPPVTITIDGQTFSTFYAGYCQLSDGASSSEPAVSDLALTITPLLYWGWGGKYDTTSGARL